VLQLGEQASATDPIIVETALPGIGPTFYARFGDWFRWTNAWFALALMIQIMAVGARIGRAPANHSLEPSAR